MEFLFTGQIPVGGQNVGKLLITTQIHWVLGLCTSYTPAFCMLSIPYCALGKIHQYAEEMLNIQKKKTRTYSTCKGQNWSLKSKQALQTDEAQNQSIDVNWSRSRTKVSSPSASYHLFWHFKNSNKNFWLLQSTLTSRHQIVSQDGKAKVSC